MYDFFELVDGDGDGLISYPEYLFFQTMLALPDRQVALAFHLFDENGDGSLDKAEFQKVMEIMRQKTPVGKQDKSMKYSVKEVPLFTTLFSKKYVKNKETKKSFDLWIEFMNSERLPLQQFQDFRNHLRQSVLKMEFELYDIDDDQTLSALEFARFLVSHTRQVRYFKCMKKLHNL